MTVQSNYASDFEKGSFENVETLDIFEHNGDVVFRHDISKGVSPRFKKADCIYSEPAWRHGYKKFMQRSNTTDFPPYKEYLLNQEKVIKELDIPAFILCGADMLRTLKPQWVQDIYFYPYKDNKNFKVAIYNCEQFKFGSDHELLGILAEKFNTILDFNCGYGNLIPFIREKGKHFILSDICGHAVLKVAKDYMGYKQ